jgi:hypothetical protein
VQVRFRYTSGSAPTASNGAWLDDLNLECYAPAATPPDLVLLQGTSMAAPHVAGAAGLLFSLKPSATVSEIRSTLLANTDPIASLTGKTTTGGRLDVARAMDALVPPDTAITSSPDATTTSTAATFQFARADAPSAAATFECRLDGAVSWSPCTSPASYTVVVGAHTFQVRAKSPHGQVDPTPASFAWTVNEPPTVDPGPGDPGPGDPGPTDPGPTGPGPSNPGVTNPGPTNPLPTPSTPKAPAPRRYCVVPKLAGKSLAQARTALTKARCRLGKVTKPKLRRGQRMPALVVKSSTPRAGIRRAVGTKVALTLKPKPKPKPKKKRR